MTKLTCHLNKTGIHKSVNADIYGINRFSLPKKETGSLEKEMSTCGKIHVSDSETLETNNKTT